MPTCSTCKFAARIDDESASCHRHPPTIVPPNTTAFPVVALKRFWCGEYRFGLKQWFNRNGRAPE